MITISINGKSVSYNRASVTKTLKAGAGDFSFSIGGASLLYGKDDKVEILVDGTKIIVGKIECIRHSASSNSIEQEYLGRDLTGDLIDSDFDKAVEYNRNLNAKKIIETIAKEYELEVVDEVELENFTNGELPTAQAGDNIFEFCDKLCRLRSGILTSSNGGGLLITYEGADKADDNILFTLNNSNIYSRDYEHDYTKEYDKYTTYSQNNSALSTKNNLVNSKSVLGKGKRKKTIIENNSLDPKECKDRSKFEQSIDRKKAMKYDIEIAGHSQSNKKAWERNMRVHIIDEFIKIDETMLITEITYNQSDSEESVKITLERLDDTAS
jgi:prophage tail gpP-like protein